MFWDYTATKVLTLEYVPGFHQNYTHACCSSSCTPCLMSFKYMSISIDRFCCLHFSVHIAGVKINNLDMIDARGFNRSRISSRSIEAYLIQVKNLNVLLF